MRFLFVILAVLTLSPPAVPAATSDVSIAHGNGFYSNCASVETPSEQWDSVQTAKMMFCYGYVEGLTHGILAVERQRTDKTFCFPSSDITNSQVVRIVRKYIAEHPERGHEVTAILAADALRGGFPCRT